MKKHDFPAFFNHNTRQHAMEILEACFALEASLQVAVSDGFQLRCSRQELESVLAAESTELSESNKKLAALIHEYAMLKSSEVAIVKRDAVAAEIADSKALHTAASSDQQQQAARSGLRSQAVNPGNEICAPAMHHVRADLLVLKIAILRMAAFARPRANDSFAK